jgi:uncharacterized protein YoxC
MRVENNIMKKIIENVKYFIKKFFYKYIEKNLVMIALALAGLAVLLMSIVAIDSLLSKRKLERDYNETRNQLARVQGTIEVSNGVYQRAAEENRNLNRRLEDVLGENTRLGEVISDREYKIEDLIQINARLREVEFSSNNTNSRVTSTVISNGRQCVQSNSVATVVDGETVISNEDMPNIRVDFDLAQSPFRAVGFTTTNPSYAELDLTQQEPFVIDLVVAQDRDGEWSAFVAEQNDMLELDISQLMVNPHVREERWYERFGIGVAGVAGQTEFLAGPVISGEIGNRSYVFAGALVSPRVEWNATVGATFRPFRRTRSMR